MFRDAGARHRHWSTSAGRFAEVNATFDELVGIPAEGALRGRADGGE